MKNVRQETLWVLQLRIVTIKIVMPLYVKKYKAKCICLDSIGLLLSSFKGEPCQSVKPRLHPRLHAAPIKCNSSAPGIYHNVPAAAQNYLNTVPAFTEPVALNIVPAASGDPNTVPAAICGSFNVVPAAAHAHHHPGTNQCLIRHHFSLLLKVCGRLIIEISKLHISILTINKNYFNCLSLCALPIGNYCDDNSESCGPKQKFLCVDGYLELCC